MTDQRKLRIRKAILAAMAVMDAKYPRAARQNLVMLDADTKSIEVREQLIKAIGNSGTYRLVSVFSPSYGDYTDSSLTEEDEQLIDEIEGEIGYGFRPPKSPAIPFVWVISDRNDPNYDGTMTAIEFTTVNS